MLFSMYRCVLVSNVGKIWVNMYIGKCSVCVCVCVCVFVYVLYVLCVCVCTYIYVGT